MTPDIDKLLKKLENKELNDKEKAILNLWYLRQFSSSIDSNSHIPKQEMWEYINSKTRRSTSIKKLVKYISAACIVFFIAFIGMYYYTKDINSRHSNSEKINNNNSYIQIDDIKIEIAELNKANLLELPSGNIWKNSEGKIEFKVGKTQKNITLHTNKSPTVLVHLLDGSKIWLDQLSSLTILPFESSRLVELDGEAYFEIEKSTNQQGINIPFFVNSQKLGIQVLGTKFSVNSRNHKDIASTILIEGAVKLINHSTNRTQILKPLETAIVAKDKVTIQHSTKEKGEEIKTELFVFDDETLADVLTRISEWYDIPLKYKTIDKQHEIISGRISKTKPIEDIIHDLQYVTTSRVTLKNNIIIIE